MFGFAVFLVVLAAVAIFQANALRISKENERLVPAAAGKRPPASNAGHSTRAANLLSYVH